MSSAVTSSIATKKPKPVVKRKRKRKMIGKAIDRFFEW